ncbi:MAG: OmpA family protein, partial [Bradyrhizobiaceae bacterium]|nr:OmpA family protein [Bradyrhizobiaceae bacterium]
MIDPLIDGITGMETAATRSIGRRIAEIAAASYPDIKVLPFTRENLTRAKFVLIGTFNPINNAGQPAGARDSFWICFALVDVQEKVVGARAVGRAQPAGIDSTPVPVFAASPVWALDNATLAYIRTCQRSKPGDAVDPAYGDRLAVRAILAEAHAAFDSGRLGDAMAEFQRIAVSPGGGEVIDALNGLYLTLMNAGWKEEAMAVFARLIDAGLRQHRLGVTFLFEPGAAVFVRDPAISAVYPAWLERIADRTRAAGVCLRIVGHASRTGPEPRNLRLTQARAAAVRDRLLQSVPQLSSRITAVGAGSSEVLVGLPVDDAQTMLDRRVEFRPDLCSKRIKARRRVVAGAAAAESHPDA